MLEVARLAHASRDLGRKPGYLGGSSRMLPPASRYRPVCLARWLVSAALAAGLFLPGTARAAAEKDQPKTRQLSPAEIEAWLDSRNLPETHDTGNSKAPEVPPPPPRHHGLVVESSIGALQHLGPLKNVTPLAPWFHLQLGFEPAKWVMLFGESDIALSSTSYAHPPPDPRTYTLFGFGGGVRLTVKPTDRFGIYAQGSIGAAKTTNDSLVTYGYTDSTSLGPYYGGALGLEWYQIDPHYALALNGGIRNYNNILDRSRSSQTALALIIAAALRYTF